MISEDEKQSRRQAIKNGIWTNEVAGLGKPSQKTLDMFELYTEGHVAIGEIYEMIYEDVDRVIFDQLKHDRSAKEV